MNEQEQGRFVYYEATRQCVLLQCLKCRKWLASGDMPTGPRYPNDGWDRALADKAFEKGWRIEYGREIEWVILCPDCASDISVINTKQVESGTQGWLQRATRVLAERRLPWRLSHRNGLLKTCIYAPVRQAVVRYLVYPRLCGAPDTVTVVIGVRNRADTRLASALASLRRQRYPQELLRIVVVDYGSTPDCLDH